MFSELIGRASTQFSQLLPFVIFRKPGERSVHALFQKNAELHQVVDYTESGFVLAPFESNGPTLLIKEDERLTASDFSGKNTHGLHGVFSTLDDFHRSFYQQLVQKAVTRIHKGILQKVVLSRQIQSDSKSSPFEVFKNILSKYPSAFCYLWYHPKIGLWLGATPETLLHVQNKQLTTMSLAGTLPYKFDEEPTWGNKEIEEQRLVTSYIQDVLISKVSDLQTKEIESVRAGNLWHLCTKISGTLQCPLSDIIKVLHPTPAVCGIPLPEAEKFILENEGYKREYYTGFLGELNIIRGKERASNKKNIENRAYMEDSVETELFVNLRCMQIREHMALIYIGGGITKDSIPEKEWEETVYKSKTMLSMLVQN